MKYKILLLIFGLIIIGSGLWLRDRSQPPAHEGTPVIVMDTWTYSMMTGRDYLRIYQDGYVIFVHEGHEPIPVSPFMTWRTAQLTNEEMTNLKSLIENMAPELLDSYQFSGFTQADGTLAMGDFDSTITINFSDVAKTITVKSFVDQNKLPYSFASLSNVYADLPSPLNSLVHALIDISDSPKLVFSQ